MRNRIEFYRERAQRKSYCHHYTVQGEREKQDTFCTTNKLFTCWFNFTRSKGAASRRFSLGSDKIMSSALDFYKNNRIKIKPAWIFFVLLSVSPIWPTLKYWWLIYKNLFRKVHFYHGCFTISSVSKMSFIAYDIKVCTQVSLTPEPPKDRYNLGTL